MLDGVTLLFKAVDVHLTEYFVMLGLTIPDARMRNVNTKNFLPEKTRFLAGQISVVTRHADKAVGMAYSY